MKNNENKWIKVNGISVVIICFETFFVVITQNAVNLAFASYDHPRPSLQNPEDNMKSLSYFPSILSESTEAQNMVWVSIVFTLIWCGGYCK